MDDLPFVSEFLNIWQHKGFKGVIITLVILFLVWFLKPFAEDFSHRILDVVFNKSENSEASAVLSQDISTKQNDNYDATIVKKLSFVPSEWIINQYDNQTQDGFYCPKTGSNFPSPEIWYKTPLPVNFRKISILYEIKSKDEQDGQTPSLIFSLGYPFRLWRFYAPQKTGGNSSQTVGFQQVKPECKSWGNCNWVAPAKTLEFPMATGAGVITELKISPQDRGDNTVGYTFLISYVSALTFEKKEKIIDYEVKIPTADPSDYLTLWGVGTFKGGCFKLLSFSVEP